MTTQNVCVKCGAPLAADARQGFCPKCLYLQAGAGLLGNEPSEFSGHESAESGADEIRNQFGDYELLEEIGRGGMGVVYRARQRSLDRVVAIKMIAFGPGASPEMVKRFHAEAVSAASLHHPNIVAIHEVGIQEGQHFFVMDWIEGQSLARLVGSQPLPARRAASYLKTIAEAVHYAHECGILHRDLKPSNVLVDLDDQPHVVDFGLARRLEGNSELTVTGQVLGSPNFLPPEQATGQRARVSRRTDVYALGATLYHLLTARPPFQAESLAQILDHVLHADPVSPRLLNPSVPRDLETICLKCLEKEPAKRYPTAHMLADELGRFLDGQPIQARPLGPVGKTWRWCRRNPRLACATGAALLSLLVGLAGVTWQWRRAERERDMALRQAYAGDMKVAQLFLAEGNLGGVNQILNKHRPVGSRLSTALAGSQTDLRGWEWRYLWGQCRSDERSKLVQEKPPGFADLAFSPDGRTLALQQWSGVIELWDPASGSRSDTLTNTGGRLAFAFSPDGKILASANVNRAGNPVVSLWEVATGHVVRELPQRFEVSSLAFTPTGDLLTTFLYQPQMSLWKLPSGRLARSFVGRESPNLERRFGLFSADGTTLVLADCGPIVVIDLQTGASREIVAASEGNAVVALALSPDGQLLASGHERSDASIGLWNVHTGELVGSLEGHRGAVLKLVFSKDGRVLYSASKDQSIRAWNVQRRREIAEWRGHGGGLWGLALSPDGKTLASCAADGSVRLWDPQGPRRRPACAALPIAVAPMDSPFTKDSQRLITASLTNLVTVWDLASVTPVEEIPPLGTNNYSVALSPDERWVVVGGFDGALKVWDRVERRLIKQWHPHLYTVFGVGFLDQGRTLYSAAAVLGKTTDVKRWEVGSWRETGFGPIDLELSSGLAQSPDQRHLAVTYFDKPLRVWECASGRLEMTLGPAPGPGLGSGANPRFSPDGRLLTATFGSIPVWEVDSQRPIAVLNQPGHSLVSVSFSPDGNRLAAGYSDGGAVEIWDYVTQRGLLSLPSRGTQTRWTAFSPDGNTLLAVSWVGLAELWHAPSWAEIEAEEKARTK